MKMNDIDIPKEIIDDLEKLARKNSAHLMIDIKSLGEKYGKYNVENIMSFLPLIYCAFQSGIHLSVMAIAAKEQKENPSLLDPLIAAYIELIQKVTPDVYDQVKLQWEGRKKDE